jgi:succinylglutamate desuccinylase
MRNANSRKFNRVLIVGGTHGNELTGIYVVRSGLGHKLDQFSFECVTLLANPGAIAINQRYVDHDLNRSFASESTARGVEAELAQTLRERFGAGGSEPVDVIIDLHTTTANMGKTLIIDEVSPDALPLAAILSAQDPSLKVYSSWGSSRRDALRTIAPLGVCIEVGPVAQGVLDATAYAQTQALLTLILQTLERINCEGFPAIMPVVKVYRYCGTIDYPRDAEGNLNAMIHPDLQARNYELLKAGDALFMDFSGGTIGYEGKLTYPIFINEAAYYEKGIAAILTEAFIVASSSESQYNEGTPSMEIS